MPDKKKPNPQQYQQKSSTRYGTYSEAKEFSNKLPESTRKRIRLRANGMFDLVVFEKTKKAVKAEAAEE